MRPIRLELSAFGPYLEHTVIDFEKLNEAGLFLITGQTGGGKTTLLDAMSIALFYKSTGGRRTFQDMRCLAAADSDRTEVVYHFALGEDEYCFRRALYRRKKRGSDDFITEEENECKRRTADGWALAASGAARNVTGYAENLLSLTAEQFSQVIVLPQGKFMQLLRANSTEKAAILKTLFSCELWERIAMKFTERQKKLYAKRETCETKLKSLLEKHGAETAEALAVQTEALRSECARTEKALAAAKEALTLAQKQYTRALQFEQCQKAETDAEAQLKTAEARAASAKAQYTRAEQNRAGLTKLTARKRHAFKTKRTAARGAGTQPAKGAAFKRTARRGGARTRRTEAGRGRPPKAAGGAAAHRGRRSIHRKGRCRKRPARVALTDADHFKRTACRAENAQ